MLVVPTTLALWRRREVDTNFSSLSLPPGIVVNHRRPVAVEFLGRLYIVGLYSPGVVIGEEADSPTWKLGITPPALAPTITAIAAPTGYTGVTGPAIPSSRFLHKRSGKIIAFSPLGPVGDRVDLADQGRRWGNLATSADDRATHIQGMLSQNGGRFRVAWEREIGATTVDEAVPTLSLGNPADEEEQAIVSSEICAKYAQRMWYARGKDKFRVYYSAPNNPEIIDGSLETLDRSPIVGLGPRSDELVLFGARGMQAVRGFTSSDFVVHVVHSSIGSLNHTGIDNIHDQLWFPYLDGVYVYDGGKPILVSEDIKDDVWMPDIKANPRAFYNSWAYHHDESTTYNLMTRRTTEPLTICYVGNYHDYYNGTGDVMWMTDGRNREDVSGLMSRIVGKRFSLSTDGFVREEDVASNANDDSDTFNKAMIIRHGVNFFGAPGGDPEEGKTFGPIYTFVESEFTGWTLNVMAGEEGIVQSIRPDNVIHWWREQVAASASSEVRTINAVSHTLVFSAKTSHWHWPERVAGQGLMIEIRATAPRQLTYRGHGGFWRPGAAPRRVLTDDAAGGGGGIGD